MRRWANGLAEKFHNPKLKLVGYLLGSIDQTAGYFAYNKTTSALFENGHGATTAGTNNIQALPPVVIVHLNRVFAPIGLEGNYASFDLSLDAL